MYYDDNIDDLDVSLSEAFQFDSLLDKAASARKVDRETVAINEHFGIYQGSKFSVMKREKNQWYHVIYTTSFYDDYTKHTFETNKYADFNSYEEALEFINGLIAFFKWFGEIVATPQKTAMNNVVQQIDAIDAMSDNIMVIVAQRNANAASDPREKRKWQEVEELYRCFTEREAIDIIEDQIGSNYVLDLEYCRELFAEC